jgi:hypothetical protein
MQHLSVRSQALVDDGPTAAMGLRRRWDQFLPAPTSRPQNANDFFDAMARLNYPSARDFTAPLTKNMPPYTLKEKARIAAGAVTALVIMAWLAIIALALLPA